MTSFSPRFREQLPLLIVLVLPVLLNLPALAGFLSPDPVAFVGSVGLAGKQFFTGAPWLDPNVGFQGQALGKLSADMWLSGHVPWWNSYNGVGLPLAAEAQPASLFLPFILLMHFQNGGAWLETLLQIIAGLCTFALLRQLKLTRLAALAGAVLFELNGTFAWHGAPISTPVAFLPMLILSVEHLRARVTENAHGGWLLIPLALAWSIYAGFPETAYIDGLLVGCWVLTRLRGLSHAHKMAFMRRLVAAVFVGLLLSMPLLVPFAEYVGRAYIGGHENFFVHARPPYSLLAHTLVPGLYGPIGAFDDPTHEIRIDWGSIGGYFTALEFLVALLGLVFCRRWLYLTLLTWVGLCLAKTFDVRPLSDLINLVPMIKSAAFFRYSPPSWEFAGAVLVALTIDGMQRRTKASNAGLTACFALAGIAIMVALGPSKRLTEALLGNPAYAPYYHVAIGWLAFSIVAGILVAMCHGQWRRAPHALVALLVLDACMAFALPVGSGYYALPPPHGGVAFLQAHAGLQRVYSLGPLAPNYGGYFRIAQINHNYLPVSRDWIQYVHDHLDAEADPIEFTGRLSESGNDRAVALPGRKQAAFEALGVRYVLARPGTSPFLSMTRSTASQADRPNMPMQLGNGGSTTIRWSLPSRPEDITVTQASVEIGNYVGKSNGRLRMKICTTLTTCVEGERSLAGSADNAPFVVTFDQPLVLEKGEETPLTATITDEQSDVPVVLWLMDSDVTQHVLIDGKDAPMAPSLVLYYAPAGGAVNANAVYRGADMDIYELPDTKPYFEASDPNCKLQPVNRTKVIAHCGQPAQLLRREAFYPGWQARVDGGAVPLQRNGEIFQSLALPAGTHKVVFSYRPTHALAIAAAFVAGLMAWMLGAWRGLRRRRAGGQDGNKSSAITIASSRPLRAG